MAGQDQLDAIATDMQARLADIGNGAIKCQCNPGQRGRSCLAVFIWKNGREYAFAWAKPNHSLADFNSSAAEAQYRQWYADLAREKGWETINA